MACFRSLGGVGGGADTSREGQWVALLVNLGVRRLLLLLLGVVVGSEVTVQRVFVGADSRYLIAVELAPVLIHELGPPAGQRCVHRHLCNIQQLLVLLQIHPQVHRVLLNLFLGELLRQLLPRRDHQVVVAVHSLAGSRRHRQRRLPPRAHDARLHGVHHLQQLRLHSQLLLLLLALLLARVRQLLLHALFLRLHASRQRRRLLPHLLRHALALLLQPPLHALPPF
mmetsp:Transcript_43826/g.83675  ORF Transcript_43826/g.83675 Transcript_43826/m.83675 type:complete len:226 (-) Transcript_43826:1344-2021(-)